jgi:hypothetical protein
VNVLKNGVLNDFSFHEWIAGDLPGLTLLMSARANSEIAIDISSRLSIDYSKALLSIKCPDVKFWSFIARGQFDLQLASKALQIYESTSIEEALLDAVAKSLGETPASLKQASSPHPSSRKLESQITSFSEMHASKPYSLQRIDAMICPPCLFTLRPLKGLETLPRETNKSCVETFSLRLSRALSAINIIEPGYSSEIGYLIDHVVPLKCDGRAIYSGSNSSLPGIVFMSSDVHDYRLIAEMAIHEAMHTKLFLLQRWDPLFESEDDINWQGCEVYSPWRQCMRPVQGVLHGAFVFTAISKFWSVLSNSHDDIAASRAATSSSESLLAINQITKHSALTSWGSRLVDSLQRLNLSILESYPSPEVMISWSPERSINSHSTSLRDNTRLHLERCHRLKGK